MDIRKILVPILLDDSPRQVALQAAWLQRRLCAEIILLHVIPPLKHRDGVLESLHEMRALGLDIQIVEQAEEYLDKAFRTEITGNAVVRLMRHGTPGHQILKAAREQNVDLIMMTSHDRWRRPSDSAPAFYHFLLQSVTAMVLEHAHCPVWIGPSYTKQAQKPPRDYAIRHMLCWAEFSWWGNRTIKRAAQLAAAVDAKLSLVHVSPGPEMIGPGGTYIDPWLKEQHEDIAQRNIARIQRELGLDTGVIIRCGNIPKNLNQITEDSGADLLVIGNFSTRTGQEDADDGYKIIKAIRIPILNL